MHLIQFAVFSFHLFVEEEWTESGGKEMNAMKDLFGHRESGSDKRIGI